MNDDHGAADAARHAIARSPELPTARSAQLAKNPHCVACKPGTNLGAALQVHHIFPFHIAWRRDALASSSTGATSSCSARPRPAKPSENHHLLIGHRDDFQSSNLDLAGDAVATFRALSALDTKANATWTTKRSAGLPPLENVTPEEKRRVSRTTSWPISSTSTRRSRRRRARATARR